MLIAQRSQACCLRGRSRSWEQSVLCSSPCLPRIRPAHHQRLQLVQSLALSNSGTPSDAHSRNEQRSLTQHSQQQHAEGEAQQLSVDAGIQTALRRCRAVCAILAGVATWTYLAAGLPSQGPLASLSLAMPVSTCGSELAVRSAWTGLATGVFHTLCGPDHLAGLTPLSIGRGRMAACALGALWGFGHSTGQLLLGLFFALLKDKFNGLMPALTKWSAYIVPCTVILIGVMGLHENMEAKPEVAAPGPEDDRLAKDKGKRAGFTTYFTGIVHGLQPDALYVVIPALALPTKLAAVLFISMFVIGTCAAMGGYTLLIGATSKALSKGKPWLQSHLSSAACGLAILCGLLMLAAGQGVNVPFFS